MLHQPFESTRVIGNWRRLDTIADPTVPDGWSTPRKLPKNWIRGKLPVTKGSWFTLHGILLRVAIGRDSRVVIVLLPDVAEDHLIGT